MKKTVLLVVDTWMAFRDFVRGRVAAAMRKDPDLEFVLCLSEDLHQLAGDDAYQGMRTVPFNHLGGKTIIARALYDWAKLVFIAEHPDNTFSQRTRWTRLARNLKADSLRIVTARLLHKMGFGSVQMVTWSQQLGSAPDFTTLLDQIKPAAFLFSTVLPGKIEFPQEARRRHIPLVLTIPTWDKPNSKGPLSVSPDWAFVWSEEMKRDMVRYHGLDPEKCWPAARSTSTTTSDSRTCPTARPSAATTASIPATPSSTMRWPLRPSFPAGLRWPRCCRAWRFKARSAVPATCWRVSVRRTIQSSMKNSADFPA